MFEELSSEREAAGSPPLPPPQGPLSDIVTRALVRRTSGHRDHLMREAVAEVLDGGIDDPIGDHDLQLALNLCLSLHYLSFREVDPAWEWDPGLIELRTWMETRFMDGVHEEVEPSEGELGAESVARILYSLEAGPSSRALEAFVERNCCAGQMAELMIHGSAERLRRTDSYLWSIPRLNGRVRETLADVLREDFPRNPKFEQTMRAFGLDDRTGAYLDLFPAATLATSNLPAMFALRRRGRGAMVGHLAAQKVLGPEADRAVARGLDRLGLDLEDAGYHEESAVAGEAMVDVAVCELAGRLAVDEPHLGPDIVFGARAYVAVQERFAEWIMRHWNDGRSSLLQEQAGFAGGGNG
jgi:hypothetical protein